MANRNSSRGIIAAAGVILFAIGTFTGYSLSSSQHANTSTATITAGQTQTVTFVQTSITYVATTVTRFPGSPWDSTNFMNPCDGGTSAFCWGDFSHSLLFDCPNSSQSQGCAVQVYNSLVNSNFTITVFYPRLGQPNEPAWANCMYSALVRPSGQPIPGGPGFAYCIPVGSTAFVVTEQGPPPA